MKTLIAFYSFEGNCRSLAAIIAEPLRADISELFPVKEPVPRGMLGKYLIGGKVSLFKETTPLQPLAHNPRDYDLVVIGGPVWFLDITPAVRTFIAENDWTGKTAALFAMHRGGKGRAISTMKQLVEERGGAVAATAEFVDLRRGSAEATRTLAVGWAVSLLGKMGKHND